jgi:fatty acid desaturase
VSVYVPGHNLSHHQNVQGAKDVIRTSKARFSWHFLNQLFFFFLVAPSLFRAERQFKDRVKKELPAWHQQLIIETIALNVFRLPLLIISWKCLIVYLLLPQLYSAWGIVGMNMIQHDGCDPNHPYNHTRTMTGRWINWWTFNNGYHGAHHMRPQMHWSLYPEFHRREISQHLHPALEQKSMIAYCWRTYIVPGKRTMYDGSSYVLAPASADEDWIPKNLRKPNASMGAVTYEMGAALLTQSG